MATSFWTIDLGNLLTLFILLVSFWGAHVENLRRIKEGEMRLTEIETKVRLLYRWFMKEKDINGE